MPDKNTQYTRANGLRLAYSDYGDPAAPAILLIMGLGTQMIAWPEPFCESLARQGFRVIRFDNRDIGLSQKLPAQEPPGIVGLAFRKQLGMSFRVPYTLMDMAVDAVSLLDALSIDRAHLVGASMGGMIAQLVAGHFPERTLSLTSIMSTSGHASLPGASPRISLQAFARPRGHQSEAAYLRRAMRTWAMIGSPGYPIDEAVLRERLAISYRRSYYPEGALRQTAAILASGDRVALLKALSTPTLVIHGEADRLVPVACGIDTARHVKNARLELIEGMGHNLPEPLLPHFVELISGHARNTA